jgi:hypothetical protein
VAVSSPEDARARDREARATVAAGRASARKAGKVEKLRRAVEQLAPSVGGVCAYTQLRNSAGLDSPSMKLAVKELVADGVLKELPGSKPRRYERRK